MSSIRTLSFSKGKSWPRTSRRRLRKEFPLGTDMARFQREFLLLLADITRPKSNDALMDRRSSSWRLRRCTVRRGSSRCPPAGRFHQFTLALARAEGSRHDDLLRNRRCPLSYSTRPSRWHREPLLEIGLLRGVVHGGDVAQFDARPVFLGQLRFDRPAHAGDGLVDVGLGTPDSRKILPDTPCRPRCRIDSFSGSRY